MEQTYDMRQYAPLFVEKQKAIEVYDDIMKLDPNHNTIVVDLTGIVSMTTICAKIIFGRLYKQLGSQVYHTNISLKGKSEGIDLVIKMGISSAMQDDFILEN